MVNKDNTMIKMLAVGTVAGLGAFALGVGGEVLFTEPEKVQVSVNNQTAIDNAVAEALANVEPEVEVEYVNITKEIDNGNLDEVLTHLYDNEGDVEYLVDDLEDDELDQIVDRIVFINESKKIAVDSVKKDLFDEVDGFVVGTETMDEHDIERLDINDEHDEISVIRYDFDNDDIVLRVKGTFEQDEVEYNFRTDVKIRDGEYDELQNIQIN